MDVLQVSLSSRIPSLTSSAQALLATFLCAGVHGDLTLVRTYTQSYSLNLGSLTIPSGTIFKPNGYPTFVTGTTTIDAGGSYNDDGNDGSGFTAGTALGLRNPLDGRSGAGGGGRSNSDGVGLIGAAPSASRTSRNALGVFGRGGAGGAAGAFAAPSTVATNGPQITQIQNWPGNVLASSAGGYTGGAGGSGGSLDWDNVNAGASGGGGSGAGIVWLTTKYLVNNGSISCNGGNGGHATSAGGTTTGGGGGGGMGGFVVVTTTSVVTGSITANGGNGGLGANGGDGGSVGDVGNVVVNIYS